MRILLAICASLLLAGCADKKPDYFNGYAEADYVRLAVPVAGTLVKVYPNRGDQVEASAPAFILGQENERAAREETALRKRRRNRRTCKREVSGRSKCIARAVQPGGSRLRTSQEITVRCDGCASDLRAKIRTCGQSASSCSAPALWP
jgi:hypothetical protein